VCLGQAIDLQKIRHDGEMELGATRIGTFALAVSLGALIAYFAGRARGAGIPTPNTMTFAGTLTDGAGAPLTGRRYVEGHLWNQAADGASLCTFGQSAVDLVGGAFRLTLTPDCVEAIHLNSNVWAEISVDGVPLGRVKIGAVPFAVESDHAISADKAASAGADFTVPGNVAVGHDLTVNGTLHLGTRISTACTWTPNGGEGYTECVCSEGEVAIGGGGYIGATGGFLQASFNPGKDTPKGSWWIACATSQFTRVPCDYSHALCARLTP